MKRLSLQATPLAGVYLLRRTRQDDARGFLSRVFCADELAEGGWQGPVAQINQTLTLSKGTVRGLHFQHPPHAEYKLVSCLRGCVWDVAVDLRRNSATFLQWHAEYLHADQGAALLIPAGFAHGFQALADDAELLYCHSAAYAPQAEAGIHPQEPRLAIAWPRPVCDLSPRDASHAWLPDDFEGVPL